MKALFCLYDIFAEFEISLIGMAFHSEEHQVVTFAPQTERGPVLAESGFRYWPDLTLAEVNVADYDVLLIPGGRPVHLLQDEALLQLIRDFRNQDKWIGAICAGPSLLAAAGILDAVAFTTSLNEEVEGFQGLFDWENYRAEDVVVDGKIITAQGNAYVEFAAEVQRQVGILQTAEDVQEFLTYFKNRK